MKYIKVSNAGVLDIVKACSMLGASVKTDASQAIGMFGTGLKYALAQASRMGIVVNLTSGQNVFETFLEADTFRGQEFQKVHLRNLHTDEEHSTPITTNFGQHDWTNLWSIYREIVCNAMDEEGFKLTLVNSIQKSNGRTSIYLPYDVFSEYYDGAKSYFSDSRERFLRKGTGIVYKKGIRVGEIEGMNLDFQADVSISESRQMCDWSARWNLGNMLSSCDDPSVWEEFLKSKDNKKIDVNCMTKHISQSFKTAMRRVHGKFMVCPDVDNITKDIGHMGYYAFVPPTNWTLAEEYLPNWKDRLAVPKEVIRKPNPEESRMIYWGLKCCRDFGMLCDNLTVKVFDDDGKASGYATMKGDEIWLAAKIFSNRRGFLNTLLEEVGHNDSGASDYTREFTDYFISKIADHYIHHS
jgi:hypothetical protein